MVVLKYFLILRIALNERSLEAENTGLVREMDKMKKMPRF